ncbi:ComF family protein [Desulforamulus aeronauticus]|uniref:ComF family protein n=1 Tax=Desulforamulus aeronauticus DSM 10349 TaxID=1121421 RepID=A0A1M6V7I4_9FIRM|nr:ComF family protein [Desulforamulus aeronauticus]SHK77286.1 comF family protein [Desulforamulus aeronauticus DSM 10349]
MHPLLEALVKLLFPTHPGCQLCGSVTGDSEGICPSCRGWLAGWAKQPHCRVCGRPLGSRHRRPSSLCPACHRQPPPFELARAVGPYEGVLRQAIHLFKFKGRKSLAPLLACLMVELIQQQLPLAQCEAILPVPLSRQRQWERGYNQAELLAKEVARGLKLPLLRETLIKYKETPPQTGLPREERKQNLKDAFLLKGPAADIFGRNLLLIDDVFTTGSTASTIAETLKAAGAGKIFVITLANAGK